MDKLLINIFDKLLSYNNINNSDIFSIYKLINIFPFFKKLKKYNEFIIHPDTKKNFKEMCENKNSYNIFTPLCIKWKFKYNEKTKFHEINMGFIKEYYSSFNSVYNCKICL